MAVISTSASAQNMAILHGSFQKNTSLSPGAIGVLFSPQVNGDVAQPAGSVPLPIEINGYRVNFNGEPCALLFAGSRSSGQINFVVPPRPQWANLFVRVELQKRQAGELVTVDFNSVPVEQFALGLFSANANGQGVPAGTFLNIFPSGAQQYLSMVAYSPSGVGVPSVHEIYPAGFTDQYAVLYTTGGAYVPANWLPQVKIGGRTDVAEAVYFGPSGFIGVQQLNVRLNSRALADRGLAQGQTVTLEIVGGGIGELRFRNSSNVYDPGQN